MRKKIKLIVGAIFVLLLVFVVVYLYFLYQNKNITEIKGLVTNTIVENTEMTFITKIRDLGRIKQFRNTNIIFNFKNTGNNPLIVYDVYTTCSCVGVVEWTKMPINQGKEGQIILHIDAAALGIVDKDIFVYSNSNPNPVTLRVYAEIYKDAN